MAITTAPPVAAPPSRVAARPATVSVPRRGIGAWLTTTDHKKIGIMYIVSTFVFFLIGGLAALLVRTQLALAEAPPFDGETYNQIFTIHAPLIPVRFIIPFRVGGPGHYPLAVSVRS